MDRTPPDTRFAVPLDEIVARAVGLVDLDDELDPTALLQDEVDNAEADLAEAKAEKRGSAELEKLKIALEACKENLRTATSVHIALHHEIDTLRRGGDSQLAIASADRDAGYLRFTKYSVHSWLQSKFNITVDEWAPPGADRESQAESVAGDCTTPTKSPKFRGDTEIGYQRTIEGLVAILLRTQPRNKYLNSDKTVNQSKIASEIHTMLERLPQHEKIPAKRTIERKLSDSGVGELRAPGENER